MNAVRHLGPYLQCIPPPVPSRVHTLLASRPSATFPCADYRHPPLPLARSSPAAS